MSYQQRSACASHWITSNLWIVLCLIATEADLHGQAGGGEVSAPAPSGMQEVFRIGKQDHSFKEFARERRPGAAVLFEVGKSSPAQDWYAYQPGTFDYEVGRSTREQDWTEMHPGSEVDLAKDRVPVPFEVNFDLPSAPRGKFILHLDAILIYGRPAAPRYTVEINGHVGSYQLTPRPAPELWWPTGGQGVQYIGYASLDMPLPASYFRKGSNALTVRCLDGFGIHYDDLALRNETGSTPRVIAATVEPTVFYKKGDSGLVELGVLRVRTSQPLGGTTVRVEAGSTRISKEINQESFGDSDTTIEIPASDQPIPVAVYVKGAPAFRGTFVP